MRGVLVASRISSQAHKAVIITAILVVTALAAYGQYTAPRIFFTDLPSAPVSGGQNNQGAFITVFGTGFGSAQGGSTVTIGGVAVARYLQWSDSRITFQPGKLSGGNIVVNVGGLSSNGIPFAVRPGNIYFVSISGSDTQRGSVVKPWRTIQKAKNAMAPGDITYVMDGVVQATLDSNNAALSITSSGSGTAPKAIIAYPGATVTVGVASGPAYGIRSSGKTNWILSGLKILGATEAIDLASGNNWRLVNNDISCPNGYGTGACLNVSSSQNVQLLGNYVHDAGNSAAPDLANYHSIAFSGVTGIDVGWNTVANTRGCRAVAFASASANQYGLRIHDNLIHDARCDAISLQGTDASQGSVQVYNNVVYRAGTGPAPGGVASTYACVNIGGSGLGSVQVLNNTLYDCGAAATADAGALSASTPVSVIDNIVYLTTGESYLTTNTSTSWLSGSNNDFYGAGAPPAPFQNSINADPLWVSPANYDFHLQAASPAVDAGVNSGVPMDYDGVPRPQGAGYDLGAFEYAGPTPTATVQLTETPSVVNFGNVAVGSSSTQSVSVANTGTTSATVTQMNVAGTGFSASGLLLPISLAPGQTTSYTVTFAPQAAGSVTGSVSLITSSSGNALAPASPASSVQLSGTAVQPAGTLAASPVAVSFGAVTLGSSASQTVTITASGANVTVSQATVTGSGFSISGLTLPVTLAAGQSAAFTMKVAPAIAGSVTGSLSIVSDASNSPALVPLSATGASPAGMLAASPTALNFSTVTVGTSSSQAVTIAASTNSVTISQANLSGAGFSISGLTLPLTLAAGQSASFTVQFAPVAAGSASGSVSLVSNASNSPVTVSLSGSGGNPVGTLTATPAALNFGTIYLGSSSTQTVTVTASTASVTVSQVNLGVAGFSISGLNLPLTLAAGQSASFTVQFAPTVVGTASGSISLVSNASNAPTTIGLSGTGATTLAHSVTLNWMASISTGVVGYNVYRSTQSGGPYTKITSTLIAASTYADSAVLAGTTYYYVVTAVSSNGVESTYSAEVSATIPTP